jgi:hypothetical protein
VWVVAVEHDYGWYAAAGWFASRADAEAWIGAEHDRRRPEWNATAREMGDPEDYDECRTEFYAVELKYGGDGRT